MCHLYLSTCSSAVTQLLSPGKVGCHLDRHENIGRGQIGLNGFRRLMNDPRFDNIPFILETPADLDDAKEVRMLYALIQV